MAYERMDWATARDCDLQSLRLAEAQADVAGAARALNALGQVARGCGEYAEARALYERGLAKRRELGEGWGIALALACLGQLFLDMDDLVHARVALEESLERSHDLGDQQGLARSLEAYAGLAALAKDPQTAWRLAGAAEALRATMGFPLSSLGSAQLARWLEHARQALDDTAISALKRSGAVLAHEEWLALARGVKIARRNDFEPRMAAQSVAGLTARQSQVLRLLAQGMTDRQIANELVLSEKTIGRHLENIYARLGVSSRAAATLVAAREGLASM